MKDYRIVLLAVVLSVVLFGVFVVIFSWSYVYLRYTHKSVLQENEPGKYEYRHFSHNFGTNSSSVGTVTIPRLLGQKEFIFYHQATRVGKRYSLISNFGAQEYVCSGSCHCDSSSEEERRYTAGGRVVFGGLKYLLVAVSSLYAYSIAKEHFEEECHKESWCPSDSVRAQIDKCEAMIDVEEIEKLFKGSDEKENPTDDVSLYEKFLDNIQRHKGYSRKEAEEYMEKSKYEYEEYMCRGKCMKRSLGRMSNEDLLDQWDAFPCESLKLELQSGGIGPISHFENEFIEVLHQHCQKHSKITYKVPVHKKFNPRGISKSHACVGARPKSNKPKRGGKNPTVKCQYLPRFDSGANLIN